MEKANLSRRIVSVATAAVMGIGIWAFNPVFIPEETVTAVSGFTAGNRILVDINANDGRKDSYAPNAQYNWIVAEGKTPTATYNGLTFTLSDASGSGKNVRSINNKTLGTYSGKYYANPCLTMDGVTIKDTDKGGTIKLEIKGLSAGTHTLSTWHSYVDNWPDGSPVTVTVNGAKSSAINVPTRITNDYDAGRSYTSFNVTSGETITVLVTPTDTGKYGAILNAFEIGGADPVNSIKNPFPKTATGITTLPKGSRGLPATAR